MNAHHAGNAPSLELLDWPGQADALGCELTFYPACSAVEPIALSPWCALDGVHAALVLGLNPFGFKEIAEDLDYWTDMRVLKALIRRHFR